MRRAVSLVALLFSAGFVLAQSYVVIDAVRLPSESYVGDAVELRYTVRTQAEPIVPEVIPQPRWGEITGLRVLPAAGGFDLRLTVVPYETGTLTLPRLDLGTVRIEGLSLSVESVLPPGDATLRPAHGPQRLPATRAALLVVGFGIAFVIALVIYLSGPGRVHISNIIGRYRSRVPYRRMLACVGLLQREITRYGIRDFYILLVQELQAFMTSRLHRNCMAATSTELIGMLPELEASCGAVAGTAAPLEEVFMAADSAKFAHRSVRLKKRTRHLKVVQAVIVELESHRRRMRWSARNQAGQRSAAVRRRAPLQRSHVGV